MYKFSISGITVTLVRDVRKKDAEKDHCPIRVRITHARNSIFYSTGYVMSKDDWEAMPKSKSPTIVKTRQSLHKLFKTHEDCVRNLAEQNRFSFSSLNTALGNATGDSLNTAFRSKIDKLYKDGKISTGDWYNNTLNNIEAYKNASIKYNQVTPEWLKGFEKHLLTLGRSYTSVSMLMRALRAIINNAKSAGVIKEVDYPFGLGKYEIPEPTGRVMALTIQQVGAIVKYVCKSTTMERARDLWFFSYMCNGVNITDICKLKYSNIENGEIYFYRQKTFGKGKMVEIRAVITPQMQDIINLYGNPDKAPGNFIFDVLDGDETPYHERRKIKNLTRHINEYMGKIGNDLGIGKISTYHARHSYATVLKRSGANISYISESLGHSNLKTTENYLAKFETEERQKNAMTLINFD